MKRFFLLIYMIVLVGCVGSSDPVIGRVELAKLNRWEKAINIDTNIESALERSRPQTHENFVQTVNMAAKQSVKQESAKLASLKISHREVQKLAKLYQEMLLLMPEAYDALLKKNEKQRSQIQQRITILERQADSLNQRLQRQFRK